MTHHVYDNVTGAQVSREFAILEHALSQCRAFNGRPGAGGRYKVSNCRFDDVTCTFVPSEGDNA